MIWRGYFSILQIDRSHMLWQLATETDAPIRAVAKHGPKKWTFRYNFNFTCTDFSSKKIFDSPTRYMITLHTPHLLTSQSFQVAYSTSTRLPRVFKSLENSEPDRYFLRWWIFYAQKGAQPFWKLPPRQKLSRNAKVFLQLPNLANYTISSVYIYIQYIQPLHLKQFRRLLRLHHTHFWWTLDRFRSMGPILGCICTRDNRALVLHMVVQLLRWDLCI